MRSLIIVVGEKSCVFSTFFNYFTTNQKPLTITRVKSKRHLKLLVGGQSSCLYIDSRLGYEKVLFLFVHEIFTPVHIQILAAKFLLKPRLFYTLDCRESTYRRPSKRSSGNILFYILGEV